MMLNLVHTHGPDIVWFELTQDLAAGGRCRAKLLYYDLITEEDVVSEDEIQVWDRYRSIEASIGDRGCGQVILRQQLTDVPLVAIIGLGCDLG